MLFLRVIASESFRTSFFWSSKLLYSQDRTPPNAGPSLVLWITITQSNFVTSGKLEPTNSVAANWYQNLGSSSISGPSGGFNLAAEYAAAKAKVAETLGTSSAIGQLAVNESPFYNWLKTNSLDRGIL